MVKRLRNEKIYEILIELTDIYERYTLICRSDLKKLVRKIQGVVLVGPVIQRGPFTHDLLYQSFVKKFSTLIL